MGGLVQEIGTLAGGGNNNSNFTSGGTNIQSPVTVDQANQAYGNAQQGLTQQQALINALAAQNGIGNQSSVFNQQQGLATALQDQANGNGPNPAMAQLAQQTGNNVQNQAALMAQSRGAGANVGLMARQAGMQGAAIQQQAVGQGATMQAQQQLAAQGQLGQQQMNMAGVAGQQVGNHIGATENYNQLAQGEQAHLLNSIAGVNNSNTAMQSNMNSANSAMAQTNANNSAKAVGGALNGASSMMSGAKGGVVGQSEISPAKGKNQRIPMPEHFNQMASIYHPAMYADGGDVSISPENQSPSANAIANAAPEQGGSGGGGGSSMLPMLMAALAKGGKVPVNGEALANSMQPVPGKAAVSGNSLKNDTVPAMLSPNEIILPRSVTMAKNAPEAAKAFVEQLQAKYMKPGKEEDDFKAALKQAISNRRSK